MTGAEVPPPHRVPAARPTEENILLVANYAPSVGYAWWLMEHFWVEIATLAEAAGARTFLAYPVPGAVPAAIQASGIEPIVCPIPKSSKRGLLRACRLIRRLRIRGMYLTDRSYWDPTYAAFRAAGVRRIVNHDHTPGDRPMRSGATALLKSLRNRLPWMHTDHWIALSELMQKRAVGNVLVPPSRVSVVPNGIVPIEPTGTEPQFVRRQFDLPEDACVVVMVGRAHPYKRVDFLVRAAAAVQHESPASSLSFLHVGDGPQLDDLQGLTRNLGIPPHRMVFAGRRDDVRSILPGCDIALHPSQGEGFSLAILEYMSAGLATVVPDVPSVAQAIDHERTGIVYPDGDLQGVVQNLLHLEADVERRRTLGRLASEVVDRRYSLQVCTRIFRRTISPLLQLEEPPPAPPE